MIAILTVVVLMSAPFSSGYTSTSQSFEVLPMADQNAYDHCTDVAAQVKQSILKDIPSARVAVSCIDKGEPTE